MPYLRCTDKDCGHEWFERSQLAAGADCTECGSPADVVGRDEEIDERPPVKQLTAPDSGKPRRGHARQVAQATLKLLGPYVPPTAVERLAGLNGLDVVVTDALPEELRAQLVNRTIELASSDSPRGRRFSIAHELGHFRMGTTHGSALKFEMEADAFAGELLVPERALREVTRKTTNVDELANLFDVSSAVVQIAAEQHGVSLR